MDTPKELFHDHPVYSLSDIAMSLHRMVEQNYSHAYYIKAEILKLNYYPYSGHCYPELVEKENNNIKTEMRAVIWSQQFQDINRRFELITGEPLKENINILCLATVEFSPKHGLALHIQDIEPTYTLGEMVKNRQAVISKLKTEGVFDQNRRLKLALLPKRVAIISVETSKGYSDFLTTLNGNQYGYKFYTELFPSILQGDKAIVGITERLSEILMRQSEFDCVVIVRGGGGDVGLSCYDDYSVAHQVATFPLPVLTGIGHSTNQSVTDMVAFSHHITPTDVAFFLIRNFMDFDAQVQDYQQCIFDRAVEMLENERRALSDIEMKRNLLTTRLVNQFGQTLSQCVQRFVLSVKQNLMTQSHQLSSCSETVVMQSRQLLQQERQLLSQRVDQIQLFYPQLFKNQKDILNNMEDKIRILHPDNILKRGYSITMFEGKAVTDARQLHTGDEIVTKVYQGEVKSKVHEN